MLRRPRYFPGEQARPWFAHGIAIMMAAACRRQKAPDTSMARRLPRKSMMPPLTNGLARVLLKKRRKEKRSEYIRQRKRSPARAGWRFLFSQTEFVKNSYGIPSYSKKQEYGKWQDEGSFPGRRTSLCQQLLTADPHASWGYLQQSCAASSSPSHR